MTSRCICFLLFISLHTAYEHGNKNWEVDTSDNKLRIIRTPSHHPYTIQKGTVIVLWSPVYDRGSREFKYDDIADDGKIKLSDGGQSNAYDPSDFAKKLNGGSAEIEFKSRGRTPYWINANVNGVKLKTKGGYKVKMKGNDIQIVGSQDTYTVHKGAVMDLLNFDKNQWERFTYNGYEEGTQNIKLVLLKQEKPDTKSVKKGFRTFRGWASKIFKRKKQSNSVQTLTLNELRKKLNSGYGIQIQAEADGDKVWIPYGEDMLNEIYEKTSSAQEDYNDLYDNYYDEYFGSFGQEAFLRGYINGFKAAK